SRSCLSPASPRWRSIPTTRRQRTLASSPSPFIFENWSTRWSGCSRRLDRRGPASGARPATPRPDPAARTFDQQNRRLVPSKTRLRRRFSPKQPERSRSGFDFLPRNERFLRFRAAFVSDPTEAALATAERARAQICARQLFQWLNASFAQLSGHEAPAALVASDPGAALCWRPVGGGKFDKAACAGPRTTFASVSEDRVWPFDNWPRTPKLLENGRNSFSL